MDNYIRIKKNWKLLDKYQIDNSSCPDIICPEEFNTKKKYNVCCIGLKFNFIKKYKFSHAYYFINALRILLKTKKNKVALINGSSFIWFYVGLLNKMFNKKIVCWDIFVETDKFWKKYLFSLALNGMTVAVVWSKDQVQTHSSFFKISDNKFIFLPYKANHSKGEKYEYPSGNYIFSGGNGKRDYKCLIDAVKGTNIPVIISSTDEIVKKNINNINNIIVVSAHEPSFAKLQAASRFVVIPMEYTGLKGGGEANFCNAMWHKKAIIAADSISAKDYIIDNYCGFVVPSGDSRRLKDKIIELWNDPEKCSIMGVNAKDHVEKYFTHEMFVERIIKLAIIVKKMSQ